MNEFEKLFEKKIAAALGTSDPAHDLLHVRRVVKSARDMGIYEQANLEVILPAAWLHDLVNLPKDHKDRKFASKLAANEAITYLSSIGYPAKFYPEIFHAIEAHSFSSGVQAETLEAKIVQDADRLDALGAIGLARLFAISAQLKTAFYHQMDPWAEGRPYDDKHFAIDHIHLKLKTIAGTMHTTYARVEAERRFKVIQDYLENLKREL